MSTATATTTDCVRSTTTDERVAAGRLDTAGLRAERGQLTLSVVQRHVRDLHVAVVAADGPCYAAAAFSGRTVVEIPSSMSSETVNQIGGNGDTTIRSTMVGFGLRASSQVVFTLVALAFVELVGIRGITLT